MSVQTTKTKKNYLIFFLSFCSLLFWLVVCDVLPIIRNWKKRRIMWNKSIGIGSISINNSSKRKWQSMKKKLERVHRRKIIETIKNRLNWGWNPKFFRIGNRYKYSIYKRLFLVDSEKRVVQRKKIVCDGNVMDWIVCACLLNRSKINSQWWIESLTL